MTDSTCEHILKYVRSRHKIYWIHYVISRVLNGRDIVMYTPLFEHINYHTTQKMIVLHITDTD
jgi:hypothetical protein